jgi:hypothetical protein
VGAQLGAHFARGCSVVLGCARFCSVLTCADDTSRRSGEWWRFQAVQGAAAERKYASAGIDVSALKGNPSGAVLCGLQKASKQQRRGR